MFSLLSVLAMSHATGCAKTKKENKKMLFMKGTFPLYFFFHFFVVHKIEVICMLPEIFHKMAKEPQAKLYHINKLCKFWLYLAIFAVKR